MDIEIRRTDSPKKMPERDFGFGKIFTDHVFRMQWGGEGGERWHSPRIEPYGEVSLDPAAVVLHYAQAIFEGMKAFRGVDGKVRLFRPDRHGARMARSAERLCIPPVPPEDFVESVKSFVALEERWVPKDPPEASLYIRPFIYASEAFLGVRPAKRFEYSIICCPVGSYYAGGFEPVKIWVEREQVRAAPGGVGSAKTGGNYAGSLQAFEKAKARGYAQVLWLDAVSHERIEEVGTMNVFVKIGDEVITPPLGGTILPGVTRDCVITLLKDRGVTVSEREITLAEVHEASKGGQLEEIFGSGTAAVISPVGALGLGDEDITVGDGQAGPLASSLRDEIVGIQRGEKEDRFGWTVPVT